MFVHSLEPPKRGSGVKGQGMPLNSESPTVNSRYTLHEVLGHGGGLSGDYHLGRYLPSTDPARREHLTQALALFERLGAKYDAEAVRKLL